MIDERKKQVLHAIVKDYVTTAEPVGSRTIAKKYDLGVSSATIRNEMSDLEEMGLIEQPHTSAGRIPSDKGYRFYVDYLMEKEELDADEINNINMFFTKRLSELDELVQETCRMLSHVTKYTALVLVPKRSEGKLEKIQMISVSPHQVLVLIVTDTGFINHRVIDLRQAISPRRLQEINFFLQEKLYGLSLEQVNRTLLGEISIHIARQEQLLDLALELMEQALMDRGDERVFTGGALNMLNQPEFRDVEKVKTLLGMLEEEEIVKKLLHKQLREGTEIFIGGEIPFEGINKCSVITGTYKVNGRVVGSIGILGPTRMTYPKAVSVVETVTDQLSLVLAKMFR
ncbi:MAG: heat-inducible transcriptional repressor HrcA [Desulfitobacteriaceae bacterium]|nr:heat-inducible transcriptional repressor HrcA [Desulfitobacteriaceae bacterium]MDD4752692.1 heat-inducible transcriptional repressor HrcA [Desulfitobacteriaceae bacterium]